ncbi:E4 protein [Human papillomavirus 104]|uniref:E4 protein n=1 Tax=Human papillomavirus 104 TaxID=518628 RepID=C4PUE4_9PAPI|nr:E4 protein [Human papillomavirus 104]
MRVLTIQRENISTTTLDLKQMLTDLALLDCGKCMLTKILCLLLSLALRRHLEAGYPFCPPTPHPSSPRPASPPHKNDTHEPDLALQPPPGGRGKEKDKKETEKERRRHRDNVSDQDQEAPAEGGGKKPQSNEGKGEEEGHEGEENPPNETPPPGEGEVEGGPKHGPGPDQEGLLMSVASCLQKWEDQYNQLVQNILVDLSDYWKRLQIPQ